MLRVSTGPKAVCTGVGVSGSISVLVLEILRELSGVTWQSSARPPHLLTVLFCAGSCRFPSGRQHRHWHPGPQQGPHRCGGTYEHSCLPPSTWECCWSPPAQPLWRGGRKRWPGHARIVTRCRAPHPHPRPHGRSPLLPQSPGCRVAGHPPCVGRAGSSGWGAALLTSRTPVLPRTGCRRPVQCTVTS